MSGKLVSSIGIFTLIEDIAFAADFQIVGELCLLFVLSFLSIFSEFCSEDSEVFKGVDLSFLSQRLVKDNYDYN